MKGKEEKQTKKKPRQDVDLTADKDDVTVNEISSGSLSTAAIDSVEATSDTKDDIQITSITKNVNETTETEDVTETTSTAVDVGACDAVEIIRTTAPNMPDATKKENEKDSKRKCRAVECLYDKFHSGLIEGMHYLLR